MTSPRWLRRHVTAMLLSASRAMVDATFSIVAADARSRQVGGAGASCNPSGDVFSGLYTSAPNRSVLHTQALLLERYNPIVVTARQMMKGSESIGDILGAMEHMDSSNSTLSVGSFPSVELRQYGMADFTTNGGYTGKSLETAYTLAGMAEGTEQIDIGSDELVEGRYSYHAMGNVVAEGTVEALRAGFLSDADDVDHCDMPRRLMTAMESVLAHGFGDMRCINGHGGISATGAYLHVDNPDGRVLVHINKPGDGSYEPIEELKREFLLWQEKIGCRLDFNSNGSVDDATEATDLPLPAGGSKSPLSELAFVLIVVGSVLSTALAVAVIALWKAWSYQKLHPADDAAIV